MAKESPCDGCYAPVEPVHACPICRVNMHPWCGTHRSYVLGNASIPISASPLVAGVDNPKQLHSMCEDELPSVLLSSDDDSDNSSKTQSIVCNSHQRARQIVSTIHDRRRVLRGMTEQAEQENAALCLRG
ncbi:TPA: hypothetical protein N0F65_004985 [Lagenidium giganteum]|uniref:Uncharacterized protein n=1 Tax=Lagenidium giganteum TaxID=4803 RepID=A0AAV2ZR41_9STRA|nr:TPA: hypothetical protein N0F65_004985 [Lagenidium giganteum]